MVRDVTVISWLATLGQTALFVLAAPLFTSWIRRIKARLQNRRPARFLQPYSDLRKLFSKQILLATTASPVFRIAPYIVFATAVTAASVVPLIFVGSPMSTAADAIVLVGLLALGRFFLALAGMDTGTTFGGMGASREMMVASLAEPAMLMVVFTLAMVAASTNLSTVIEHTLNTPLTLRPSLLFAFLALLMVGIAETGRIPVDNPTTHLELTMIHEAMILEYTGRHLALMEWASMIKLMLYGVLVSNLFVPWGIAQTLHPLALLTATVLLAVKLGLLGACLAVAEMLVAKMRLFRVPTFLAIAFTISLVGMLSYVILEAA